MAQDHWRKVEKAPHRLVLCRLMIDIMRTVHGAYAPASDPFGTRLETFFIGLCIGVGDFDGKPFSVAKIATSRRSEQGYLGIDRFGHFAGLTQPAPPTEPLASAWLRQLSGDAII